MSTITNRNESRTSRANGIFAVLHHEAAEHARASNAAAGLAARHYQAGDQIAAAGARALAAYHRARLGTARARALEALIDALAGEDLEREYRQREVLA